jgi:uncharacterized protein (UPF0332 family)
LNDSEALLIKTERFIRSARILADDGDFDSAASRLYYAMFFLAEALLAARGASFSSHSAVISAFGQQFAKTKEIDPRFHRALLTGFSQRQLGDYAVSSGLSNVDIESLNSEAVSFLVAARGWLQEQASSDRQQP